METGTEALMKPDRAPDYIAPAGHAFWWSEMIMMHVYGHFFKLTIDQNDGSLCYTLPRHSKDEVITLPARAKELYDEWWYQTFESKFLGSEDD